MAGIPDYSKVARSPKFQELLKAKKSFLAPMTAFFLAYYFTLPILTSYTDVLNRPAFGAITWAWVFAFSQFIMTWVLCGIYTSRAAKFDAMAQAVTREEK